MKPGILEIYTDGAAIGNPGPGGWAAILVWGPHRREISGAYQRTTNNRMELLAVIRALEAINRDGLKIDLYTDSMYVRNAWEEKWIQGWQKRGWKNVKNIDLWKQFIALSSRFNLKMHWVKGHAGHPENERCDELATNAARNGPYLTDTVYEQTEAGNNAGNNLFRADE